MTVKWVRLMVVVGILIPVFLFLCAAYGRLFLWGA